ncbi:MAG: hypothetical protein HPY90_11700 [Syntrophothermus sp.]|uniref:hypothetical protein n=1 Tax=Syntrophothermus sp. TaxID=2736299 RepID=UPI00257DA5C4|nr:hypothetical protein [Syntrophothermus sp.]NSW83911.1 hypothetical protein [Syntrophothermus sp.]
MDLPQKVKHLKAEEKALMDRAKEKVGEKFAGYVQGLVRNEKIANTKITITPELADLGVFSTEKGTFLPVAKPYIGSAGRVEMAVSELLEGKTYPEEQKIKVLPSKIIEINKMFFVEKTVITPRGEATALAKINFGGTGVDTTNPVENAETSALARALGMLGYGLIETGGLASAEEVISAQQEKAEQGKKQRPASAETPAAKAAANNAANKAESIQVSEPDSIQFELLDEIINITDSKTQKQIACRYGVELSTGIKRILYTEPSLMEKIRILPPGTVITTAAQILEQKNIAIIRELLAA